MRKWKNSLIMYLLSCVHFIILAAMFALCWFWNYRYPASQDIYYLHSRTVCAVYIFLLWGLSKVYDSYKIGEYRLADLFVSHTLANLFSWCLSYAVACIMAQRFLNPLAGLFTLFIQSIVSALWLIATNRFYFRFHSPKRTVVFYRNEGDLHKLDELLQYERKWNIALRVQCFHQDMHDLPNPYPVSTDVNTELSKEADFAIDHNIYKIKEIIRDFDAVVVSGINATFRNGIAKLCLDAGKSCYFVPHTGDVIIAGSKHVRALSVPICKLERGKIEYSYAIAKRVFDIIFSFVGLAVFSPLMLCVAIAIKLSDGGPILFRQKRLTRDGKEFSILKFRSMVVNAEKDGVARLASQNDDRIIPIGKIIRPTRIDELPQLLNILCGSMSFVGPRPERPEIAEQYAKELPAFSLRLQVKAGLTGYAQVYGRYNTEPADKLKMDLMYINRITKGSGIAEDLRLMLATMRVLFMRESTAGVAEGQTTAAKSNAEKSA